MKITPLEIKFTQNDKLDKPMVLACFIPQAGYTDSDVDECITELEKVFPNHTIRVYESQASWKLRAER